MKHLMLLSFQFALLLSSYGQNLDFTIIGINDSESICPRPVIKDSQHQPLVIDNDSIFDATFRYCSIDIRKPYFNKHILLKRTIKGSCLLKIENEFKIDSVNQIIIWEVKVVRGSCASSDQRNIVIQIPSPPAHYNIVFDEAPIISEAAAEEGENQIKELTVDQTSAASNICLLTAQANRCLNWRLIPCAIDSDSVFNELISSCEFKCDRPNFNTHLLLFNNYYGDCHMSVMPQVLWDPVTQIILLNGYNIWGGCRASGQRSVSLLVNKPTVDYQVVFQQVLVESREEAEELIKR